MRSHARRERGATLVEQLAIIAILGATAAAALPGLSGFVLDQRELARRNAFVAGIQHARSEALRRNRSVTLCPSADGVRCGKDFGRGWLVFVDLDRDGARADDEELVTVERLDPPGRVLSPRPRFTYHPLGRRSTNGTVTFCHPADPGRSRAVVVSYTGRPRITRRLPDGGALPC